MTHQLLSRLTAADFRQHPEWNLVPDTSDALDDAQVRPQALQRQRQRRQS